MPVDKYKPACDLAPEQITLKNKQFARFVSRRKGVSAAALSSAMRILTEGLVEALAEGYNIQWVGLGTFQVRQMKSRMRYHRITRQVYMAPPFTMLHFKKSKLLAKTVKDNARARIAALSQKPTLPPEKIPAGGQKRK